MEISGEDWGKIKGKDKTLYVIGLVEYVDMFGVCHRAGYARRLAPGRAENNLVFVAEAAFSYDVEIDESERLTGNAPPP